jgi:hypothetical protein
VESVRPARFAARSRELFVLLASVLLFAVG